MTKAVGLPVARKQEALRALEPRKRLSHTKPEVSSALCFSQIAKRISGDLNDIEIQIHFRNHRLRKYRISRCQHMRFEAGALQTHTPIFIKANPTGLTNPRLGKAFFPKRNLTLRRSGSCAD